MLQIVDFPNTDPNLQQSFAFVIFVAHGAASVENFIGPIKNEDWPTFYNELGVLGSARPGGFYCDGVDEKNPGGRDFNPRERPRYQSPQSRCPQNPHALLAVPGDERLASGPKTPSPPPPDVTGFVQVVDQTALTLGPGSDPRGMLASLHPFVGDPAGCQKQADHPAAKALGTYVQRAVDAVKIFGSGLK